MRFEDTTFFAILWLLVFTVGPYATIRYWALEKWGKFFAMFTFYCVLLWFDFPSIFKGLVCGMFFFVPFALFSMQYWVRTVRGDAE